MSLIRALYLSERLYLVLCGMVVLFVAGHFVPALFPVARLSLLVGALLVGVDLWLLFRTRMGFSAERRLPARLSNGDDNPVVLDLANRYPFRVRAGVHEELPFQFQIRDARYRVRLEPGASRRLTYSVRPTERGEYAFGAVNVYVESPLGLVQRRYRFEAGRTVPVYPSFIQMKQYEFLALGHRLDEVGVKKVRRLGHTMEFDHIREYVVGDDPRAVNWKATARRGALMVNQYEDQRAQPVYCLLDMGRVMKMPFGGMTLFDYGVNATLVLANIALLRQDRAGLITFADRIGPTLPASRRGGQIYRFQEVLYNLRTGFKETDFARVAVQVRRKVHRRSLLLLFTNFETRSGMRRQLPYLRALARRHVVVVFFFRNTELDALRGAAPRTIEDLYVRMTAEKFAREKREIVRELGRHGIHALYTAPEELSVRVINEYLALKARGVV